MKTFQRCQVVAYGLMAALCAVQMTGSEAVAQGRTLNLNSQGTHRRHSTPFKENGAPGTSRYAAGGLRITSGSTARFGNTQQVKQGNTTSTSETAVGELRGRADWDPTMSLDVENGNIEGPSVGVQGEANLYRSRSGVSHDDGNGNTASASLETTVGAQGEARAGARVDENGVGVGARAGAFVGARTDVTAQTNSEDAVLGVADVGTDSRGSVTVGAGAEADGGLGITRNGVTAKGQAGAFAGARAGGDVGVNVGGVGGRAEGEAWAGVGAEADGEASFKNGKLVLGGKLGAGLGVGGKVGAKVEIDFNEVGETVTNTTAKVDQGFKDVDKGIDLGLTTIEKDLGLDPQSQARDSIGFGIGINNGQPKVDLNLNLKGTERVLRIGGAVVDREIGKIGEAIGPIAGIKLPPVQLPPIELPPIRVPDFKLPPVKIPPIRVPEIKLPSIQVPPIRAPQIKAPQIRLPQVKIPQIRAPQFRLPQVKIPPIRAPRIKVPQIKAPQIKVPQVRIPPVKVPQIKLPQIKIPPIKVPPIKVPQIKLPF